MGNKYTPGPWVLWIDHSEVFAGVDVNEPGRIRGTRVAVCDPEDLYGDGLDEFDTEDDDDAFEDAKETAVANARLMAAAPLMLGAIRTVLDYFDARNLGDPAKALANDLRNVIAKATEP